MNKGRNEISFSNELDNCTFAKTVLMLAVVIGHCFDFWTGSWFTANPAMEAPALGVIADYCNSFHIFAFAMISGYIYSFIKWEKGGYNDFGKFLSNKAKRLIIPYFFAAIVWIIPITNLYYNWSLRDNIVRFVLCTNPAQLWFLWMLFDVFIMAWLLSDVLKNDIAAIAVSFISFGIGFVGNRTFPNIFCIWTGFLYFPFFILGMKLREHKRGLIRIIPWWGYTIIHIILFAVCEYLNTMDGTILMLATKGIELVMHVAGALSAFFILQKMADGFDWKNSKFIQFFMQRSMPIYLFHQQVIYIIIYWLNGRVNPYINSMANILASFAVSIIISSILIRFKATRFLVGEK